MGNNMGNLLIPNIDEGILNQLKKNAELTGISPEKQVVSILQSAMDHQDQHRQEDILDLADSIRRKHAQRQKTDSTIVIREDRNNR